MPVSPLSSPLRRALADAQLTSAEITALKASIASGEVKPAELALLAQKYGDLFTAGAGKALIAIAPAQAHVTITAPVRSLGDSRAAADVLNGTTTLSKGSPSKAAVMAYQHALESLASREAKPDYSLASGVDGAFGNETTTAVRAFQRDNALPVTGVIDQATALELENHLMQKAPPDIGGITGPMLPVPDGARIAQAARDLISARAQDYGVAGTWKSPNPKIPGNTSPGQTPLGATNRWKCNLFGMDSLYAGGAKTPHYPGGFYPIAIEIPNYSRGADAPLIKLGEVWTRDANAQTRIDALLKIARPGDVIIVNHPGTETADGGHTRIVVASSYGTNGVIECAQAGQGEAHIVGERLTSFTGEEAFYLLRPAASR
jgi:peptidoglycan hydrolase-like protein with peptidoglycan-binding domain